MPIETGRYCTHCTDQNGQLQSFGQRFARMTAWQARRRPGTPRAEIERQTLDYMATMPAWRDHPRIISRTSQPSQPPSIRMTPRPPPTTGRPVTRCRAAPRHTAKDRPDGPSCST
jgi:hypothetical protein